MNVEKGSRVGERPLLDSISQDHFLARCSAAVLAARIVQIPNTSQSLDLVGVRVVDVTRNSPLRDVLRTVLNATDSVGLEGRLQEVVEVGRFGPDRGGTAVDGVLFNRQGSRLR